MSADGANPQSGPSTRDSLVMIRTLAGVAAVSGLLIVVVFQLTLPTIKANRAEALRKAVFLVIPGAQTVRTYRLEEDGALRPLEEEDERAVKFYAGYSGDGALAGVAIEAQGQGFQDVIKVIYGYDPQRETLVGMKVLESKETPGLGDKIDKDPDFLASVSDLDVRPREGGEGQLHPIEVVKHGTRKERWQIDSITGATISSKAVGKLLNQSARERLPQLRRNLDSITARQ